MIRRLVYVFRIFRPEIVAKIFYNNMYHSCFFTTKYFANENLSKQTFVGLQYVLKTSSRNVLKTSSKRLPRNNFSSSKTS